MSIATVCICPMGLPPFDHLLESNPKCLAHRKDIQLVAAGWFRNGELWSRPYMSAPYDDSLEGAASHFLLTESEAYDILLAEKELTHV